jgi:Uma2 family endonuclease
VYLTPNLSRFGERYGEGADLVMEVVSDDAVSRARDYQDKRRDYAETGIPEYWIIDPAERRILVLQLAGDAYAVLGEYTEGEDASSRLLDGFRVNVSQLLQAGQA